jgi:4-amino-4-deoxy-L-arabinose transferase-like glycosyltransferase
LELNIKNNSTLIFLIGLTAAIVFIPFIGVCPLFDWDEVNFAECAREMIVSGNYSRVQLNYQPFWEKPPFFIWLQALSMNIFGVNEFAARFPNAMCSIASFISVFLVGKKFHSRQFGLTWCLLYAASLLPHFYFKSGIIDPWFNLFIFLSIYNSIQFINNPLNRKAYTRALLAGIFLGLAVLTKGPAALLIVALTLLSWMIWKRQLRLMFSVPFIVFTLTTLLVASSWFISQWLSGNGKIISEFITYQIRLFQTGDAGHDGPFVYHFVVLLVGCFPASLLFIASYLKHNELTPYQKLYRQIFICLFWVVLIFFSITKTKIIHYSSLCYYPLTFIAAIGLVINFNTLKFRSLLKVVYWLIAGLLALAFLGVGLFEFFKDSILESGIIKDEFAALNLRAEAGWEGFEYLLGALLMASSYYIYEAVQQSNEKTLHKGLVLNLVFIVLVIASIVPKIELYSQHAAIEFYKERAKEHCYVETHGFKSYAYLFYSNRKPQDYTNPDQIDFIKRQLDLMESEGHSRLSSYPTSNLFWMEFGKIDRPAYIVVKTPSEKEVASIQDFKKLYQKNGFSFFVRHPSDTAK